MFFSLTGAWFLIKKQKLGWLLWLIANGFCIWLYIDTKLYILIFIQFVYVLMNFYGWRKWQKN
jgi:nicotinamide riboside transporter PnuC